MEKRLEKRLQAGQIAMSRIRRRVSLTMLVLAVSSGVACGFLYNAEYSNCDTMSPVGGFGLAFAKALTQDFIFVLLCLAPLPDDILLMRVVLAALVILLALSFFMTYDWFTEGPPCGWACPESSVGLLLLASSRVADLIFVCCVARPMCCLPPLRMEAELWVAVAIWLALHVLIGSLYGIATVLACSKVSMSWMCALGHVVALLIVRWPGLRQRIQARLGRPLNACSLRAAGAGLAGLAGDCSAKEALAQARLRFRRVRADRVTYEDLLSSPTDTVPAEELFERAEPTKLGKCDAFLSHSWHDDVDAKWVALQEWRATFVARRGREPYLWLDKFCINQVDIEADLRGLPVFILGCREMLVFCGPTYLSRLWCVMELFTFIHAGCEPDRMTLVRLVRDGHEVDDEAVIDQAVEGFDVNQCECVVSSDKDKMLQIIRLAFGEVPRFNAELHRILKTIGLVESTSPLESDFSSDCESLASADNASETSITISSAGA